MWIAMLACAVAYSLQTIPGFLDLPNVVGSIVYDGAKLLGAGFIALRAVVRPQQRWGWGLLALALALNGVGDILWATVYLEASTVPVPSSADIAYLASYVPFSLAVFMLARPEHGLRSGLWLDGIIATTLAVLLIAEVVFQPLSATWTDLDLAATLTNAAYPLADAVLIGGVVGALALREWRFDVPLCLLVGGLVAFVVSDVAYLLTVANGTYAAPSVVDLGWIAGAVIFARAAWASSTRPPSAVPGRAVSVLPAVAGAIGVVVLLLEAVGGRDLVSLVLSGAVILLSFARFALTSLAHHGLLSASREEAATDALTGLGNRRSLLRDLDDPASRRRVLVLFDLDGFKLYNDTFGHPAGDSLLRRIGDVLAREVGEAGTAYRLGGDEFCALLPASAALDPQVAGRGLAEAMAVTGPGFHVGASFGVVVLPDEAATSTEALNIVDARLYACKNSRRGSAGRQTTDVLLAVLSERTPDLADHVDAVADLAEAVGRRMGVEGSDLERLRHAAALHDVGKIAIPEDVLAKPGPLEDHEWALVRQHTVIGERVLQAAPALADVGAVVRASHERWDGAGYPDGLSADGIPLGSRIIFACDAFDAMTKPRPYQPARREAAAVVELRRCAGGQFDPEVVEALVAELAARRAAPALSRT